MNNPHLARIRLHPIKSLDAVEYNSVRISSHGMLDNDRSYAIFEGNGNIIKAKDSAEMHQLHADVDIETYNVDFRIHKKKDVVRFHLERDRVKIGEWLSRFFNRPVKLQRDERLGFADDWTSPGPTLISTATLEAVASWFEELDVEELRKRFRANLEIDGVPAFWEDQLYGPQEGDLVRFKIGDVELFGKNSCQRCPVPTRDVESGERTKGFSRIFTQQRKASLQPWAHESRFNHFYRVAINTIAAKIAPGAELKIGDSLEILGPASLNELQ